MKTPEQVERDRLYTREKYRQRTEAKTCGLCGGTLTDPHKRTCDTCLAKVSHWGQRTRAERRNQGLCPHCGAPRASDRKFCGECLVKAKARYQERKKANVCVLCGAKPQEVATKCKECAEKTATRTRDWRDRLIAEAMRAYGGCRCVCCGEEEFAFLTLDHINGGGNQHRRELKKTKGCSDIYSALKKQGYPPGYQVLCMNCNWAKGKYGECPHERKRRLAANTPS